MTVPDGSRPGLRPVWQRAALLIAGFVALLYAIEAVDAAAPAELDSAGIEPRSADGLWGVVFAPVLHADWAHLSANTIPLLVLGFLVLVSGIGRGLAATAIIWIVGGLGTWLTAGAGFVHIGASILVFGWLTYLITRGIFTRQANQIVIGVIVLFVYGSILWGVLPSDPRVSWQGHLFGAVGGVLAAWLLSADERRRRRSPAVPTSPYR
ncbi:rhomboid family protein [Rhodococcus ruber Chol-4]|jgi:membrane associated rhomboid family serine protease|uniref:Peptidase S54 rhomboid domain-containing protein n=1 Tax=Rhodococcus ruber TaxID=1830 RepID=A0A098BIE3_9NOCA|nr:MULTISPECIES: rhomboid family intramembrane serine protease [Rhodococcus]MDO2379235.1 rhomboid family intramembrane serine protease [Rhodococcus ruber]RIK06833.1 MAG: rhomboid family intramembrane serine protease [Acidobacteriota bacterium]ATQ27283.1 rhomboid family intramembrane serine protease [Rhodococcus ruber]AUM15724.1 rhomboid family intramembrane serine protease [Rhodococcus ruber]AWG98663.1 rhomboid family intramembrane serine protease [Rhodococcus ruber]